jgi:hypothetical protein
MQARQRRHLPIPHFKHYDINSEMELVITLLQVLSFLEKAAIRRTHKNQGN